MVMQLVEGPARVSDLAAPLPMSLPSVLQHLGVLEAAGLVESEKRGRTRICRLAPDRLAEIESWAVAQRQRWERRFDRLDAVLHAQRGDEDGSE